MNAWRKTYYVYVDGAVRPYGTVPRGTTNHDGLGVQVTSPRPLQAAWRAVRATYRHLVGDDLPPAPLRGVIDLY